MSERTIGVILAGGLGRRMGGGDKGLREVGGRPVLARVVDRLGPQVAELVINANGDPVRLAGFGCRVVADDLPDNPGPLAGILAGLEHAAASGAGWVVSVPADAPFLPTDLAERLHAERGQALMAVASSGGRTHPVIALWPVAMRAALRDALLDGRRKVGDVTGGAAIVAWPDYPVDPFFNVNTPEDLAAAGVLAARR